MVHQYGKLADIYESQVTHLEQNDPYIKFPTVNSDFNL